MMTILCMLFLIIALSGIFFGSVLWFVDKNHEHESQEYERNNKY